MDQIIEFGIFIVVFLYSVILHEIAHGWVANYYGDDTARISGRLSLNPLVHIDPFGSILMPALLYFSTGFAFGYAKPVPVNPVRLRGGAASYRMVALAGIVTNLVLAAMAGLVLKIATQQFGLPFNNLGVVFFQTAFLLNIVLGVFNAIPLPGFDGFNFLTSFGGVGSFVSRTPLGNPYFMARYGMFVSLMLLLLFWRPIQQLIYFFLNIFLRIFGL